MRLIHVCFLLANTTVTTLGSSRVGIIPTAGTYVPVYPVGGHAVGVPAAPVSPGGRFSRQISSTSTPSPQQQHYRTPPPPPPQGYYFEHQQQQLPPRTAGKPQQFHLPSPKTLFTAIYEYKAQGEDELNIEKGDLIEVEPNNI